MSFEIWHYNAIEYFISNVIKNFFLMSLKYSNQNFIQIIIAISFKKELKISLMFY